MNLMPRTIRYPEIEVIFKEPISGYWDGGKQSDFTFTPTFVETYSKEFKPNAIIRWGSFGANFYFHAKSGQSWKQAISIAKRKLLRLVQTDVPIKEIRVDWRVQVLDDDDDDDYDSDGWILTAGEWKHRKHD